MKLWTQLAEAGVLIGPGRYFNSDEGSANPAECHFRISFSFATVRSFLMPFRVAAPDPLLGRGLEKGGGDLWQGRA